MALYLFEFMDQPWIPASLHKTLREVLEFHLRVTLSYYYTWAARSALAKAEQLGLDAVSEMGAGAAGFSQNLAASIRTQKKDLHVEISDLRPDAKRYRQLEQSFPGILRATMEPVDFSTRAPPGESLLVLSAAFHHIPPAAKARVLRVLIHRRVMIFESVTRNAQSILGCAVGFLPAMVTPLYFIGNPIGRWRRFVWCWLVPVAPLMVAWDGVVSCLRCWTEDEWRTELQELGLRDSAISIERRGFSHLISW